MIGYPFLARSIQPLTGFLNDTLRTLLLSEYGFRRGFLGDFFPKALAISLAM